MQLAALTQHISKAGKRHPLLVGLLEQFSQKRGAFEPPMAKELRIEGGDEQWSYAHRRFQLIELLAASLQGVARVLFHPFGRHGWPVRLLLIQG